MKGVVGLSLSYIYIYYILLCQCSETVQLRRNLPRQNTLVGLGLYRGKVQN